MHINKKESTMHHHIIGDAAGKVWNLLEKNGKMNVTQLTKALNEKPATINQAIGWLAREDKIEFEVKGARSLIVLKK